jgi:hypothetical protein
MGVTTIILLGDNPDEERIKNFWTPVHLKYKDRPEFEFIGVKDRDSKGPWGKPLVFVTDWYHVPTYEGLCALEAVKTKEDIQAIGLDKMYDIRNF